jgi:hypothetical protein
VNTSDRGPLRFQSIDPTRGDVDPTLRLDLLVRVQAVPAGVSGRNLFTITPTAPPASALPVIKGPIVPARPIPTNPITAVNNTPPPLNIPLKYYGFVRPSNGQTSRGLFLDGDNVLVATEGETVKQRYLVVELNANSARLEDMQLKQGQTLPVVPVATP